MKIMCIDYGLARIGCAISDIMGIIANPIGTINEKHFPTQVSKVANLAIEKKAEKILIGLPRNMDGSEGNLTNIIKEFKEKLQEIVQIECIYVDERLSSVAAHKYLNQADFKGSQKRRKIIDTVSAVIILQSYLDSINM